MFIVGDFINVEQVLEMKDIVSKRSRREKRDMPRYRGEIVMYAGLDDISGYNGVREEHFLLEKPMECCAKEGVHTGAKYMMGKRLTGNIPLIPYDHQSSKAYTLVQWDVKSKDKQYVASHQLKN